MHAAEIPLGLIGSILAGQEAGRFVEVLDDTDKTGGYLIVTYADAQRSPEVFDSWVATLDDVRAYFRESRWRVNRQHRSP